ncbi:MAG: rhamnosidase, partial [Armatimonadia bacterium]|nr:rhamnosidase [Armatimonadia bacterium]
MSQRHSLLCIAIGLLLATSVLAAPMGLECEATTEPLGIDTPQPRFSWHMDDDRRGAHQTAYQVVVGRTADPEGDVVWDTGRVESSDCVGIEYDGAPLEPMARYYWTVRQWDHEGQATDWADVTWFETGPMSAADWAGQWIAPVDEEVAEGLRSAQWIWHPTTRGGGETVLLRTETDLADREVASAEMVVSVDDIYTLYVNGVALGGDDEWESLDTFDLTEHLVPGMNTVALEVTNETDGPCGAVAALTVEFADGEIGEVVTGRDWTTFDGDADGWTVTGFDDSDWEPAAVIAPYGAQPWGSVGSQGGGARSCFLRTEMDLPADAVRARAYASGLGLYELHINGQRVGDDWLTPGWTHYPTRIQYQTYDVTDLLSEGANAVGAVLGGGWWAQGMAGQWRQGPPRLILTLAIELDGGEVLTVGTDPTWRWQESPIVFDSFYHGETYDARLEIPGWSEPGLDDSGWSPVTPTDDSLEPLDAQQCPTIQVTEELAVETITEPQD